MGAKRPSVLATLRRIIRETPMTQELSITPQEYYMLLEELIETPSLGYWGGKIESIYGVQLKVEGEDTHGAS